MTGGRAPACKSLADRVAALAADLIMDFRSPSGRLRWQPASQLLVNPYQRCGYSDLSCARIYFFLYCRVQKWVGGDGSGVSNRVDPKKNTFLL